MAFVSQVVLESGRTEYRVFRQLADAIQHLQIARNAFENGREVRTRDGEIELVTDYSVLQISTEDVRLAVDQVKNGDGFLVHNREKDHRQRELELIRLEAARVKCEGDYKAMFDLLEP
jgi:hypothetical protein